MTNFEAQARGYLHFAAFAGLAAERSDPREIDNRAQLPSMRPVLENLCSCLDALRKQQAMHAHGGRRVSRFWTSSAISN
jgi:hypothetical protein